MFINIVLAQGLNQAGSIMDKIAKDAGAADYSTPQELIGTGINAALAMVGLIFLILMIYAGYLWLTSHGEEEPIKKAQKIIVSSIIGFILVVSAYAITVFVGQRFEVGGGGTAGDDECAKFNSDFACQDISSCTWGDPKSEKIWANCNKLNFCEQNKCDGKEDNIVCCLGTQPAGEFFCEIICVKAEGFSKEYKSEPIKWGMVSKELYEEDVAKCVSGDECKVVKFGDDGFAQTEETCLPSLLQGSNCELHITGSDGCSKNDDCEEGYVCDCIDCADEGNCIAQ